MRRISEKTMEVSFTKRIVAIIMMVSYIFVLCPVTLFAESVTNDTEAKRTVSVREEKSEVLISAEEGGTVTLGEASIEIPEGALRKDTRISITRLLKVEDTGESLYNAIPHSGGYRFLPAGTKFEKDVTITLPYSSQLNAKPQSLDELYTYFYDTQKKSWIKLERLEVDKKNHKVRSLSTHFTDMINATLTMPESASPVDVNLNSIKNLEAAKPDSHLIKFNPPKASNMGDASFSFELAVPAGRKGMQPQISVSYSSGGGNGIMGKGFDVSYGSSITTDTRFGLPNYDTRDTYMLDGILLEEKTRKGDEITYKPLKETSFSRIKRFMSDNHWEVTDKSGVKRIYAQDSSSCTGSGNKTFAWNLTRTEDARGNSVAYKYEKQDGYVYPISIHYTGFDGTEGNYSVAFNYDNDSASARQDVRIEARSREIIACRRLLSSITTQYKNNPAIRTYSFKYTEGLAKEKMLASLSVENNANETYEYTFDYEEPEKDANGNIIYFATANKWEDGKALQTGSSTSIGSNFNTGTAGGYGLRVVDLRLGGGVSGSVSSGENYTEDTMIDINGDGRPDAISQDGDTIKVYLNTGNGFETEAREIRITKGKFSSDIDHEDTSSSTFGWNIYTGAGLKSDSVSASLGVGYSEVYQKSSSTSKCSFMDMNRDGLVDIVESGKTTYLKNKGNLIFEETPIYSSVVVEDIQQQVSEEKAEEYRKTYLVQTPFRMWKAPYEGIISIREKAHTADDSYNPESNTVIKTFIGSSPSDEELEKAVKKDEEISVSKSNFEISKDTDIYFISDSGKEPLNSDIDWNIEIDYSKVKPFKKGYPQPVFNYTKFPDEKIYSYVSSANENHFESECKEKAGKEFSVSEIGSEVLMSVYSVDTETNYDSSDESYTCTVKFTYNQNWQSELSESQLETVYKALVANGYIYPSVFTASQFDEYLDSIEKSSAEQKDDKYYSFFAGHFVRSVTQDMYMLKSFKTDEEIKEFFEKYPMTGELATKAMANYKVNVFELNLQKETASYDMVRNYLAENNLRAEKNIGTVFKLEGSNHKTIVVGKYGNLPMIYDFVERALFVKNEADLSAPEFNYEIISDSGSIVIGVNKDFKGIYESVITISPNNLSYKAGSLSASEMAEIIDDIPVKYTDSHDEHWILTEENYLKESEIETLFSTMTLTSEQKSAIIETLYQKKDKYKKITEGQEEKTVLDYSYYILKETPDYEKAGEILYEYKKNKVLTELFPFYKKIGNDYLLDESKIKKAEDEKNLIDECSKFFFGKCESLRIEQHIENEHLYDINSEKEYSLIVIDNTLTVTEIKGSLPKIHWKSSEDFVSAEDIELADAGYTKAIYEYQEKEKNEMNGDIVEGDASVIIKNDEFLYGGRNNWFYGIWKGALCDVPFSEDKLREFRKDENISESEFNDKKQQISSTKSYADTTQKSDENDVIHFYLPKTGVESAKLSELEAIKDDSVSYSVNYNASLCGTVSVYSEAVREGNSRTVKKTYYMPFISGNTIHTNRIGGISYYSIEGLYKPACSVGTTGTAFVVPSIRRAFTTGTDITPNASAKVGISVSETIGDAENNIKNTSAGELDASLSKGWNKSESSVMQSIHDINGNGIPDIIQYTNGKLIVVEGKIDENTNVIKYDSIDSLSNVDAISENKTDTNVFGGSVSAQGNVSVSATKGGKLCLVKQSASPTPSSGITSLSGTSTQTKGLIDLNGDGLPDFYDGSVLKLNNGSNFSSYKDAYVFSSDMTRSTNSSIAANFSIGKSYGGQEVNSLKTSGSLSLGGSYSASSSNTEKMFMDINGDGLQDILEMSAGKSSISISYNTGKGFVRGDDISLQGWGNLISEHLAHFQTQGDSHGFDLPFIKKIPLVGTAVGKGLSDTVANPYGLDAMKLANSLEWNSSITLGLSGSLGANVNIGFDIITPVGYFGTINMTFNAGEGLNTSTSINGVSVRMMDLNGDGLADHVLRVPGYCTYWKRNISGRYGKLIKVNLPQGGNVRLEYAEKYGTTDNPNFKYVLSKVTMNDGCDKVLPKTSHGEHSVTTVYEYEDGYYDRARKDFYGFQTVKTINSDGTYKIDEYYNREYYAKGSIKESKSYASDNILLSRSTAELLDSPCPLPIKEESWTYEKSSGTNNHIHSATEYEYDEYGNCTRVTQDFGDGEKLVGVIQYDNSNTGSYIIGLPTDISVYNASGNLLRHRAGVYNGYGEITELHQYYDSNSYSINKLSYTKHGNIESVKDSRGATLSYKYDGDEYMFVNEISQSGMGTDTYTSYMTYDPITQVKEEEIDCNGNSLQYKYDDWQRIKEIWTSYDTGTTPAVSYEYNTPNNDSFGHHELWYAITNNKVTFDADDDSIIQTVLQIDGLGRAVRTAKTGFVNGVEGWNASGAVEYDSKGRTIREGMTEFIQGDIQTLLESVPKMTSLFTSYEYDEKDRQVKTILPDGSAQTNAFYIEENNLISETTDPLGNVSVQKTDSRGNIVGVAKKDQDGNLLTKVTYEYNAMGEMLKAFDAKQNPITVEYDLLGRRTALESLDSGRQEFFYDECSNLVRENNSVLRENNKQINYEYDGLNRLVKIDYPDSEDTLYVYGGANDTHGAAGKILSVTDASGSLEYEYGKLGEVTKETRTLSTHLNGNNPSETAVMEYRSDYLGRMQWIIYPDGEKITYGYDNGGQVVSVKGEHWGHDFDYVTNILYDQYGQRTRIDYGNGTFTEYNYDPARRWLDSIKTENKWGQSYQNITYSFDAVGNVLGYENNCLDSVTGNYKTKQTYSYDNLYQLIKVEGETTYNPYKSSSPEFVSNYSQLFEFDSDCLGNMTSKVSKETVSPQKSIGDNLNYSFNYVYDENYAHRLVRAGDRYYKYDSNGNIICEQDGAFDGSEAVSYHKISQESEDVYSTDYGWGLFKEDDKGGSGKTNRTKYKRTYKWNERNQLISSVDDNYNTAYVYGQDGQRSNKYTQNSETLYFNKMWTHHTDSGNSIYGGQTSKNIYLGETRIVTKLNAGKEPTYQEEYYKQYYYHSDHLGSASLISDYKGDEYQRIEYTPYGEIWVEKTSNIGLEWLPYKFTAKELDEETGLYYYGARYLDPKYSRWISTDPALSAYMSGYSVGGGGIYNHFNFNLYHYANNNPVKYTDPTGMWIDNEDGTYTAEPGDTLYDLYGDDWQNKSGFTRDPRTLQIGETVGRKRENIKSDSPSTNVNNSQSQNIELWDFYAGKSDDGLTRALYTRGVINNDLNNGQLNLTIDLGGAEYGFETPTLSLFGGKIKVRMDGTLGTFTGQGSIGVKDFALGLDGDISMLKAAGTIHLCLFGINSKISLEGFLGGLAGGWRYGFNLFSKYAYGIGGSISVAPEDIEGFIKEFSK